MATTQLVTERAKEWMLEQLEALANRENWPAAFDDDEYRLLRSERVVALRILIAAVRKQW